MSQYSTGTASVTNGSATVTGSNTLWLANVTAGDSFTVAGDGVMYDVASVDSDTQVTLSAPYAGTTASGVVYAIGTGFTVPDSFPEMSQGDIETATIFTRAMRKIQGKFSALVSDISTNTSDISTNTSDIAISVAGKAREDLLKQATLSLDFANNKYEIYEGPVNSLTQMPFNEALDFTRASSATARTATGKIQEVLTDEQRLVGNREGLLIEEQRTNLWGLPEDLSQYANVFEDTLKSPAGNTGYKLILQNETTLTQSIIGGGISLVPGKTYTISFYVKKDGIDSVVFIASNSHIIDPRQGFQIEDASNGWQRIISTTVAKLNSGVGIYLRIRGDSGDGVKGLYIYGGQIEEGSYATSYIPTAGTQVTRAADNCVRVLGDEFNPNEFSFYLEAPIPRLFDDRNAHLIEFSDGSNNNRYLLRRGVNSTDLVFRGITPANGVIFTMTLGIAALSNQTAKISASVSSTSATLVVDGVSVSDTVSDALPVVTQFKLGTKWDGSNSIGEAVFKDVQLYPEALSESELITLTGGT